MPIDDGARPEPRTPHAAAVPERRPPADDAPRGGGYDRTPPQDVAAEQCVLGGMLLSKDAIADVIEILKPNDFYRPHHATVFDAVLDLYGRGEPADAITVAAALADSGELARIGGAPYLHTLIAAVPTAANASYYARIVGERAILRRLVEAGTRIVQIGYGSASGGTRDVDDAVDLAQQAVYDVTERRVSEDFAVLADMLQPTLDEIEAVGASGGMMTGVPTGFSDLDRLLNGLHAGQLIIVAGRPGLGKALALDTPLATPDGWTTMGEVAAGDLVLGADGRPTRVTEAFAVRYGRPCYEVEFSDGSVVVADAAHLWVTTTRACRDRAPAPALPDRAAVGAANAAGGMPGGAPPAPTTEPDTDKTWTVTTRQIAETLRDPVDGRPRHAVAACAPLVLPHRDDLPVPPYDLGVRLGPGVRPGATDGGATDGGGADGGGADGGGADGAHIPPAYLRASVAQRRDLLAGLVDASGARTAAGSVRLATGSARLARDVRELVSSLGRRCALTGGPASGANGAAYRLTFPAADAAGRRDIVDVRPVSSVPVRCIAVDSADHLYLAGPTMVPTHNSTAAMDFARSASLKHNLSSCIFSLEMSKVEIVMRLLSAEARVPLHTLRSGQLSDDDWTKLARRMGEISEAPLFVDDTPNMNLMEIRAKARRLKQRHDLKLIVVDYLQLMSSPKRVESRQQEVSELSRGLKLLAKEIECPVIAVSQLNRGPEQRTDKRPQLSDLRESGCLTAETRVLRADTGAETTLGELFETGARDVPVWALDERLKFVRRHLTHVFSTGERQVYRLRLASGREVRATGNHPFLTRDGWTPLAGLAVGTRLAAPRHVPAPERVTTWDDGRVVSLGLAGGGSREERVPDDVFSLPKRQVALFLRHLWAAGGAVRVRPEGGRGPVGRIHYAAANRRLADDVARLLWRFGIQSRIAPTGRAGDRDGYRVHVHEAGDQEAFCRVVGAEDDRAATADVLRQKLLDIRAGIDADTVPRRVWERVGAILAEPATPRRQGAAAISARLHASTPGTGGPARGRIARVAALLEDNQLEMLATNDVTWDEITAIEPDGVETVYDATVAGAHNFVANGIAVHNSIEQDADVVILLHRDDYYDKESPRAGEADFIVAKHRNGPTDSVTVAAQLHLSRFVDMAL